MAMHLVKRFGRLTDLVRAGRWADRGTVAGRRPRRRGPRRRRLRPDRPARRRPGGRARDEGAGLRPGQPSRRPMCAARPGGAVSPQRRDHPAPAATPESTHHLVDAEIARRVQAGAILVNCGRGGLIDIDAVYSALLDGRLAGVGLDVFDPEPPAAPPAVRPPRRRAHPAPDGAEHARGRPRPSPTRPRASSTCWTGRTTGRGGQPAVAERGRRAGGVADEGPAHRQGRPGQRRHPGPGRRHRPGRRPGGCRGGDLRAQRRARREGGRRADRRGRRGRLRAGRRQRRGAGRRPRSRRRSSGTGGSTGWSTRPASPPAAPCWTPPRSCSTSTSR